MPIARPHGRRDPRGRRGAVRRGHGQPGLSHRRIRARAPNGPGEPCLRRYRRRGGRVPASRSSSRTPAPSRYDQIVQMIEQSEKLKSAAEKQGRPSGRQAGALHPGRQLLMTLSADPERDPCPVRADGGFLLRPEAGHASGRAVCHARGRRRATSTVKGGKFLEALAQADTIVFDKTGTLTRACPTVVQVVPFQRAKRKRTCSAWPPAWRSTSPTPWPTPWCEAAKRRGPLTTRRCTPKVDYIVAHGIASSGG